MNSDYKHG